MKYNNICDGIFLARPNRFLAKVKIGDGEETVHVKNTGRLQEIFQKGVSVFLEDHKDEMGMRKTRYSLIGAIKEETGEMINVDSQAPNKVVKEALEEGFLKLPGMSGNYSLIKGEKTFGDSRFDFYVEAVSEDGTIEKAYVEVKGVTLEMDGVSRFPDAPTERGVKHIYELCKAREEGYLGYIIFVIQMGGVGHFEPNTATHKAFSDALNHAEQRGVKILAYDCQVGRDALCLRNPIPVKLL